jgi:hypothetical protein
VGWKNVWGLAYAGDLLYALTSQDGETGELIHIDEGTGKGTKIRNLSFNALGAGARIER